MRQRGASVPVVSHFTRTVAQARQVWEDLRESESKDTEPQRPGRKSEVPFSHYVTQESETLPQNRDVDM